MKLNAVLTRMAFQPGDTWVRTGTYATQPSSASAPIEALAQPAMAAIPASGRRPEASVAEGAASVIDGPTRPASAASRRSRAIRHYGASAAPGNGGGSDELSVPGAKTPARAASCSAGRPPHGSG